MSKERSVGHAGPGTRRSPGPWAVFEHVDRSGLVIGPPYEQGGVLDGHVKEVCTMRGIDKPRYLGDRFMGGEVNDAQRANAAFIVLAVNSHDALLEACKALPDFDLDNPDAADFKDNAKHFMRAMRLARSAIASAEQGESR